MSIYYSIYCEKLKWVKKANASSLYKLPMKRIIKRWAVSVVQKSCSVQLIATVQAVQYRQFFIIVSAAITKKYKEEFRWHYFLITKRKGCFTPSFKDTCKQSLLFLSCICEYDVVWDTLPYSLSHSSSSTGSFLAIRVSGGGRQTRHWACVSPTLLISRSYFCSWRQLQLLLPLITYHQLWSLFL